jgi:hypothetical protein
MTKVYILNKVEDNGFSDWYESQIIASEDHTKILDYLYNLDNKAILLK